MTTRQSLRKRGKRGNIRWTSTRNSLRQSLDDDVKISVVLREAPTKLRDNLLVNSRQSESNYNMVRVIVQACLNSNKSSIANDFRNNTKESDPMEVGHKGKGDAKGKGKSKCKGAKPDKQDKECSVCG